MQLNRFEDQEYLEDQDSDIENPSYYTNGYETDKTFIEYEED